MLHIRPIISSKTMSNMILTGKVNLNINEKVKNRPLIPLQTYTRSMRAMTFMNRLITLIGFSSTKKPVLIPCHCQGNTKPVLAPNKALGGTQIPGCMANLRATEA